MSGNNISFCYWCESDNQVWHKIKFSLDGIDLDDDIDGSDYLLECFDGNLETYQVYVKDYFNRM